MVGLAEHESSPVGVERTSREETGYKQTGIEEMVVEEEVGVDGLSETIVVTNYVTEHEKAVDMGPLGNQRGAVFIALSTPQIKVVGQQGNPVADMSARELVDMVTENYDGISNVVHDSDGTVTILDQSTTQSRFSADAKFDGTDVDVNLHVSEAVETGDDLIVTIGVYPRRVRQQEEENVLHLMESVIENVDEDDSDDEQTDDEDHEDTDQGNENKSDEDQGTESGEDGGIGIGDSSLYSVS